MDLGFPDLTLYEIVEYTGAALEQCLAIPEYKEYTAFCEVVEHRTTMPANLIYIQQIARNNCWEEEPTCPITIAQQVEATEESCIVEPALLDCQGNIINGCDFTHRRPFFAWDLAYLEFMDTLVAQDCYSPVRLKNHSFFNTLVCKEFDESLYSTCRDEYGVDGEDLILSFREGQIAISYFGPPIDKDGNIMIPDHETFIQAAISYIRYKKLGKKYDLDPTNAIGNALERAEQDWHWYCRQAINSGLFEGGKDGMQDIRDISSWILPPGNKYNSFFGNLTYTQNRPLILGAERTIGQ